MPGRGPNPWWVVAAATCAQIVGQGPVLQFTFGVFLKPIIAEFGWSRGTASLALTMALALTALSAPFAGRLMDRFGVGRVGLLAVILFAAGLMAVGAFATTPAVFIVIYALVGVVASGQCPLPYTKAIAMIFDRRRGLALGVALNGVGIGSIVIPQIAQYLIGTVGWRGAYMGIGVLVLVVAAPLLAFVIGPACGDGRRKAAAVAAPSAPTEGVAASAALRDPRLYILGLALFLAAGAANGTIAHVAPLITDHGVPAAVAVGLLGLVGLASIAGRVVAGLALDIWPGGRVAAAFLGLTMVGVLILAGPLSLPLAAAALIFIGLGLGAEANMVGFMVARYFGTRAYGELFGYMFGAFLLASSIGPALMGLWFDQAGSYAPCLYAFAGGLVASAILFQFLGPYAYARAAAPGGLKAAPLNPAGGASRG